MGREVGGGFRMENTCKSMVDSCQCMAKPLQYCKVISLQLIKINGKKKKDENFVLFGRFAEDLSPEGSFSDNSECLRPRGQGESQDI